MRSSLLTILLLINLLNHVLADQILAAHAGGTFGRSSHEPKYKIEFHSDESPFHPDEDQESLMMSNKEGQKYLCFLPKVEKPKIGKPVTQQNTSNVIVETERRLKLKTPDELLEVLKGECLVRHEGWWSYEFCYQKKLRQFHLEDEKAVQEFILGVYDAESTAAFNHNLTDVSTLKDPRSKDASQRYHAHQYTNGTICDLTNDPRETEVRFVCSESRVMISSITELSTCKYALTIQWPMLCKHPMFQEERPVWHTINCNKLPKDYRDVDVDDSFRDKDIAMITDIEVLSHYDSEQYAT
ncbi:protein OS-9 homolog isoform X2 [Telopea speciosissima]|uniref:protein OS-9 homolog isoform X2 n=1 Tax=Telopea speciosissima TaxID=54955 RepID=UPI001CC7ED78|nr:protein OS-9 homolog isoform X2 [Telopea speciosissima]